MHSIGAGLSSSSADGDDVTIPLIKRDESCQAIDESTGEPCGETEGLRILDEFRKLYEGRIEKIDRETGGETSDRVSVSSVSYRNGIALHDVSFDSLLASSVRYFMFDIKCSGTAAAP